MTDPDPNATLKQEAAAVTAQAELLKAKTELVKAQKAHDEAGNPPDATAKREAAAATAQTELLKAKTELLKAQKAHDEASKPPDAAAEADAAEKARLGRLREISEARKALADSQKAADLASAQAAIGTVTGSGIEGTVTVKADAGKGEATLLAARAVRLAANRIAEKVADRLNGKEVVLLQSGDYPQFGNYRQFQLQIELLKQQFKSAVDGANAVAGEAKARPMAALSAIPPITAAGVALDAVAKLGSYFLSNYEIGGVGLTPDNDQLVSALSGALTDRHAKVVLPGRRIPMPLDAADLLGPLLAKRDEADHAIARLAQKAQSLRNDLAAASNDDAAKQRITADLTRCDQATAELKAALTKVGEFIATLGVADSKGQILATKIAQEKIVVDKLAASVLALIVDVRAMAGGYYTKKNLWTFLGRMPFYVMGGAVVTYQLVDQDGVVQASGLVPVHGGYKSAHAVEELMKPNGKVAGLGPPP